MDESDIVVEVSAPKLDDLLAAHWKSRTVPQSLGGRVQVDSQEGWSEG